MKIRDLIGGGGSVSTGAGPRFSFTLFCSSLMVHG
ncbi:hypothetical protein AALP_AA2G111300 [Arabis alpina]|uniref:Uncharacterized protein n=1 Tax=Arabis alpina TaxID=50452 RepID=A0A087HGP1_ARAAL|nr:hypothetical protein AALP_AA2G111300 [Arabis alpina]